VGGFRYLGSWFRRFCGFLFSADPVKVVKQQIKNSAVQKLDIKFLLVSGLS